MNPMPSSDTFAGNPLTDDSDSTTSKLPHSLARCKRTRVLNSNSSRSSNVAENEIDDNCTSSDSSDVDDADDEDWVAADCDKKRSGRGHLVNQSIDDQKSTVHYSARVRPLNRVTPNRQKRSNSRSRKSLPHQALSKNATQASARRNNARLVGKCQPPERSLSKELAKPRQCFGPGCTRAAARPDTKYCSDECGMKLAIRRLEVLLPERLGKSCELDRSESVAEKLDKLRLEAIQREKCAMRDRLLQLELEHENLSNLINRARESKPDASEAAAIEEAIQEAEQAEQLEPVICVTCSSEVSMRHALRHMEKCFQKMEGSTVFCANQKEQVMGTPLFCDTYDNQSKAYCKRLRVVCEHFKEPKLPSDTICGFPLVRHVFTESEEFCIVPRSKCSRHLGWERLRRAHIDMERYRCLIRMDEVLQEEQRLQQSLSRRGGLLGALLHQTVDHKPTVPVPIPAELWKT